MHFSTPTTGATIPRRRRYGLAPSRAPPHWGQSEIQSSRNLFRSKILREVLRNGQKIVSVTWPDPKVPFPLFWPAVRPIFCADPSAFFPELSFRNARPPPPP